MRRENGRKAYCVTWKVDQESLDDLVTVFSKMSDDQDRIKSNVADLQLASMKLGTRGSDEGEP